MINKQDILDAETLWGFHCRVDSIHNLSDALIIGLGSYDIRVAEYCAELCLISNSNMIIFTGKNGNWTRDLWGDDVIKASIFADIAKQKGVHMPHF